MKKFLILLFLPISYFFFLAVEDGFAKYESFITNRESERCDQEINDSIEDIVREYEVRTYPYENNALDFVNLVCIQN